MGPWSGFRDLEERLNQIFGGFPMDMETMGGAWAPAVDLHEGKDAYTLVADLPGIPREGIELNVVDDLITLKGERKEESERDEAGYRRIERSYGSFQRSFRIPGGFDAAKVSATYKDGVLSVTLPKRAEHQPREIKVNVS
jgi:HSP20 family protein